MRVVVRVCALVRAVVCALVRALVCACVCACVWLCALVVVCTCACVRLCVCALVSALVRHSSFVVMNHHRLVPHPQFAFSQTRSATSRRAVPNWTTKRLRCGSEKEDEAAQMTCCCSFLPSCTNKDVQSLGECRLFRYCSALLSQRHSPFHVTMIANRLLRTQHGR